MRKYYKLHNNAPDNVLCLKLKHLAYKNPLKKSLTSQETYYQLITFFWVSQIFQFIKASLLSSGLFRQTESICFNLLDSSVSHDLPTFFYFIFFQLSLLLINHFQYWHCRRYTDWMGFQFLSAGGSPPLTNLTHRHSLKFFLQMSEK